jgi:hypothetical protein
MTDVTYMTKSKTTTLCNNGLMIHLTFYGLTKFLKLGKVAHN